MQGVLKTHHHLIAAIALVGDDPVDHLGLAVRTPQAVTRPPVWMRKSLRAPRVAARLLVHRHPIPTRRAHGARPLRRPVADCRA